jgi:arginase
MKTSRIALIGAPSSIGIKPYEDGRARWLDRAPGILRSLGLAARLGAEDAGDVNPPAYRDFERLPGRVRNENEVATYSRSLATRVAEAAGRGRFPLVLGGDCSVVLGCCLGLKMAGAAPLGLVYADGHADFATPSESRTGSAASMCLGLAVGRGETALSRLGGAEPLVPAENVALVGRRDFNEPWYGQQALAPAGVLDLPGPALRDGGPGPIAARVLERVGRPDLSGFWVHVDADVLDESVMAAVDSPATGGPGIDDLAALLAPLARHPRALGMELTIYDPRLDPDLACARRLVELLVKVLA